MSQLLTTSRHISLRIEDTISQARQFVYILSPRLSYFPQTIFSKIYEALGRGVKVNLIYREAELRDPEEVAKLEKLRGINLNCNERLRSSVYFSETDVVVTSVNLTTNMEKDHIVFGIHFKKKYSPDMYDDLLKESRNTLGEGIKMIFHEKKFVAFADVQAKEEQKRKEIEATLPPPLPIEATKKLTVKEKQSLIVEIFARQCQECKVKVEDAERIRVQGAGIVLHTTKERVDVIFVRYDVYQARVEEVKDYVMSRHPDLKAWFTYNRINITAQNAAEISTLFGTLKEAVVLFGLINQ